MPATEETYRSQPTLHVVFAITSIAMTLAIVWMIMADHLRPWKQVQRDFHRIEDAKLKASEAAKQKELDERSLSQIEAIDAKIEAAKRLAEENSSQIRAVDKELREIGGRFTRIDTEKRFQKAELDSQRSLYDGMIDRNEEAAARTYVNTTIVASERKLLALTEEFEKVDAEMRRAQAKKAALLGHIDDLVKEKERLTRDVERARRLVAQKEAQYFGPLAWLRGLPGIDVAAPPTRIQQISLPDLTINYNFKDVPRYDRCTTCHQGIDRLGYDKDAEGKPMPSVYAAHPHLADGATAIDPTGKVVTAGLYLDGNGPHKINTFGCTICHGGQGSGTDFTYASHEPNDLEEKEHWEQKYHWHEIHHWDEPMLPTRFLQSSCLKCHHQVTDVPQADKLQAGYQRIVKYGCTGCHTIGGEGSFGPDLTDERQVGPNLGHLGSKVSRDWALKWIKNPHAFRPDTRMPRYYGLTNNDARGDWPKNHAEIHAITHYLFSKSTPPAEFVDPPAKGDAARGKELFLQKGCMACHAHKEYEPGTFPESVREYAKADYGPNLSNIAAKFQSQDQGYRWLANWIKAPEAYHPKSLMPNVQLSFQDSADIASWILSIPGEWPEPVDHPGRRLRRGQGRARRAGQALRHQGGHHPRGQAGRGPAQRGRQLREVEALAGREADVHRRADHQPARLLRVPQHRGVRERQADRDPAQRLGLQEPDEARLRAHRRVPPGPAGRRPAGAGRHRSLLPGEARRAHPLGLPLREAPPAAELRLQEDRRGPEGLGRAAPDAAVQLGERPGGDRGGHDLRARPDRREDPRQVSPEVVRHPEPDGGGAGGQAPESVQLHGVPRPRDAQVHDRTGHQDRGRADRVRYEREGVVQQSRDRLPRRSSIPALSYDPKTPPELKPDDGKGATIEGMPIGIFEDDVTVQLWRPVTIRGYSFNVGDNVTVNRTKVTTTPPKGGDFAWLYATYQAEKSGTDFATFWNRLPPPLLREGTKVQTPWLTAFLKDPYPIRPAAQLRMPRFHYSKLDDVSPHDTRELANYFPASDGADFPYQPIPEREQDYLTKLEKQHPGYLGAGWQLMTKGACVQCHAIGQYQPTGGAEVVNGPDLRQVSPRFRPGYLAEWLANPAPADPVHGHAAEHPPPRAAAAGRPQDVRGPAAGDGQGDARHAPELRERHRGSTGQRPARRLEAAGRRPEAAGPAGRRPQGRGRRPVTRPETRPGFGGPPGSPEPDVRDRSDYNDMASRAGPLPVRS